MKEKIFSIHSPLPASFVAASRLLAPPVRRPPHLSPRACCCATTSLTPATLSIVPASLPTFPLSASLPSLPHPCRPSPALLAGRRPLIVVSPECCSSSRHVFSSLTFARSRTWKVLILEARLPPLAGSCVSRRREHGDPILLINVGEKRTPVWLPVKASNDNANKAQGKQRGYEGGTQKVYWAETKVKRQTVQRYCVTTLNCPSI